MADMMIAAGYLQQYGCRLDIALKDIKNLMETEDVIYDSATCCFIVNKGPSVYYWIDGAVYKRFK